MGAKLPTPHLGHALRQLHNAVLEEWRKTDDRQATGSKVVIGDRRTTSKINLDQRTP